MRRGHGYTLAVMALVLALGLVSAVRIVAGGGGAHASPPSVASSMPAITARWRYQPVPGGDLGAVKRSDAQLARRYDAYQRAWSNYQKRLHHCEAVPLPAICTADTLHMQCQDQLLVTCLGPVIPALDAARGALHDEAIELEQAAQQLAGETE